MNPLAPDVRVSGNPYLVRDLQPVFAEANIRAEFRERDFPPQAYVHRTEDGHVIPYYYVPPFPPELVIELLTAAVGAVLTVLLKTVLERWLTWPSLTVTVEDQTGSRWRFKGTARQVKAQIESVLGLKQCMNCRSLVPAKNFCDICGSALRF